MDIQTLLKDMRGKVEPYVAKGQILAGISLSTLKQANGVVMDGMQSVVKSQVSAGKAILGSAQKSFDKVKADGIAAVAAAPTAYLPEGRKYVFDACQDAFTVFNKTSGDVAELVKKGYASASAKLTGKPTSRRGKPAGTKRSTGKAAPKTAAPQKARSSTGRKPKAKSGEGAAASPAPEPKGSPAPDANG